MNPFFKSNLAQANTDEPVTRDVRIMTIGVEGHSPVTGMGGRCAKVRRGCIITPSVAPLVTVTRVTRNEEAGVEPVITDQQLVIVSIAGSNRLPQSTDSSIPVVRSGRYGHFNPSFEVGLFSSLVINEHNFCKLTRIRIARLGLKNK